MVGPLLAVALNVQSVKYELQVFGERCVRAVWWQAGKILANILVAGATVLFRAGAQAYRQAIISELVDTCLAACCSPGFKALQGGLFAENMSCRRGKGRCWRGRGCHRCCCKQVCVPDKPAGSSADTGCRAECLFGGGAQGRAGIWPIAAFRAMCTFSDCV